MINKSVLIATGIFPPDIGGPATYTKALIEGLVERGYKIIIVTYSDKISNINPPAGGQKSKIERVLRRLPRGIKHAIYFWKVFKNGWGGDVIYAMDATAVGLPACLAAKILRKKFLIRIGGDLLWERAAESGVFESSMDDFYKSDKYLSFKPLIFKIIKFVLRRADKIIVTADNLKPIYKDYYGISNDKIEIIHNVFIKQEIDKNIKNNKEKTILFAGRLVKYKNLDLLVDVVNELKIEGHKIKLIIVGEGPEREALESRIKNQELQNFIEFRKSISGEELRELIGKIDVGISAAWTEYNPNFILECIGLGKPVLLSRGNGLSIKLPEKFLVDPFNKEEIKEKILDLFNNYEEAKDFFESAIWRIKIQNDWDDIINKLICLF